MNVRRFFAIIAASLAIASPAAAGDLRQGAKAVIELFTSQGCSSCPKADAMFDALAKRRDVVALAYHVDYWDYIGWADTFGAKANSDLQRDYANSWGSSRIFTPQLIVNGAGSVVGSREDEVKTALASATLPLEVGLSTSDEMLDVAIAPKAGLNDGVVWLVTFIDRANVAIERGENEGKEVTYSQIVTGRQVLGMWEPGSGAHLKLPLSEVLTGKSNGAVILVQEERNGLPGPILGASSFTR
jgi:hypothetical protein